MNYELPTVLEIGGEFYDIRYDYRCILDIFAAMEDTELERSDRIKVALLILYPDIDSIPPEHHAEAVEKCFWFINGGFQEKRDPGPALVSWTQDIPYIIAPVSKVLGQEIRSVPYDIAHNSGGLHWWTFLSAYMEIGDCLFAQIVRIRSMKAKGKPLDKTDQEWYRSNRQLVDMKQAYTEEEEDFLRQLGLK